MISTPVKASGKCDLDRSQRDPNPWTEGQTTITWLFSHSQRELHNCNNPWTSTCLGLNKVQHILPLAPLERKDVVGKLGCSRCYWICNNMKSLLEEKKSLQAFHKSFPYLHYYFFPCCHGANWKTILKTLLHFGCNFRRHYDVLTQSFNLYWS